MKQHRCFRRTRVRVGSVEGARIPRDVAALVAEQTDRVDQSRCVTTVAVDEHDALRPPASATPVLDEHTAQRVVTERDGAGKTLMLTARAVAQGRRDECRRVVEVRVNTRHHRTRDTGVGVER
ncbi:Uncharacterised protein [Mycobacteroides abscessus subsp. abscessus]|nr:Uncharacterised protein [Mycobacteroides abscessus subsp. abscessus]